MSDLPFSTLIKENKCKERWYPNSVYNYKRAFIVDCNISNWEAMQSNIAYNMQYIEFLEKELSELKVSDVLYTMIVKTYVITAMSVLEVIFANLIKSNGWWKKTNLESLGTTQANETKFGDDKLIVKTELLKKVEPYELQMNLDEFIKILSSHHLALEVDHLIYPALRRLKDLRNRIHLQKVESRTDHDYNAFDNSILEEMRKILYDVLSSEKVCRNKNVIEFLNK